MSGLFITSTGTGIGKTFLTEQLLQFDLAHKRCLLASKPIITGWPHQRELIPETDTGRLVAAQALPYDEATINKISCWRYEAPFTPAKAAQMAQKAIVPQALIAHSEASLLEAKQQQQLHLFEGVGGVMAPINGQFTVLDWIEALKCPSIVVTGSYLGTLSHTLTALSVLEMRKCPILGVVITESPQSNIPLVETLESLQEVVPAIPLFLLPKEAAQRSFCLKSLYMVLLQYLLSHTMSPLQLTI